MANNSFYWSKEWHIARAHVLRRDNWTCQHCGHYGKNEKHKLRVDHIKELGTHPHLALVESNLRTLCSACDNRRHRDKRAGYSVPVGLDGSPVGEGWA